MKKKINERFLIIRVVKMPELRPLNNVWVVKIGNSKKVSAIRNTEEQACDVARHIASLRGKLPQIHIKK